MSLIALGMLKEHYAKALGIERAEDVRLGFDCAGTIAAVGEDVTDFKVGDEVVASFAGIFASHAIEIQELVAHKPAGMSFEAAAAIPTVFLTAYIGLHKLADLKRGERVLIHSGAGGVGQAAIQWAQCVRRRDLRDRQPGQVGVPEGQGVSHVMNSRTLDFADEILRAHRRAKAWTWCSTACPAKPARRALAC